MSSLPRATGVDRNLTYYILYTDGSGKVVSKNGHDEEKSGKYIRMRSVDETVEAGDICHPLKQ